MFVLHFYTYCYFRVQVAIIMLKSCKIARFSCIVTVYFAMFTIFVEARGTRSCIRVYGSGVLGQFIPTITLQT